MTERPDIETLQGVNYMIMSYYRAESLAEQSDSHEGKRLMMCLSSDKCSVFEVYGMWKPAAKQV